MGSVTTLSIGNLEIDWQKNHISHNHSKIFQKSDFTTKPLPYDEDEDTGKVIYKDETVLSRHLSAMKRRLDLLGYNEKSIRVIFEEMESEWDSYYSESPPMKYDDFVKLVNSFDIVNIAPTFDFIHNGYDPGELVSGDVFRTENFKGETIKLHKDEGMFFENLHPYVFLRLLTENSLNHQQEIVWSYQDLIEGGWEKDEDIFSELGSTDKFLIVTEGSSDTNILKKAMKDLAPDVFDFFHFIDMKDNYPFAGTGSLLNFCKGLASIQVQNKILVLLDNDVAGVKTFNRLQELNQPSSLVAAVLPNLSDMENFSTIGTDGESNNNINGKAVSIECFLDLNYELSERHSTPRVRWSNYDTELDCYHGALEYKETYIKKYLKLNETPEHYNTDKLKFLVDYIIYTCSEVAGKLLVNKG